VVGVGSLGLESRASYDDFIAIFEVKWLVDEGIHGDQCFDSVMCGVRAVNLSDDRFKGIIAGFHFETIHVERRFLVSGWIPS